ncbi:MAG: O-methyltransferase [Proteobacteria bacterium]|nr:O-methyltransferase [Pseudomonadota bacterium]
MTIYKDQKAIQLTPDLREYLLASSVREAPVLQKLREHTATMPEKDMQILPEQGQFMAMLIKILQPKNILEIGTYTGYSALCMALAAPSAKVTVLDVNVEWTKIAEKYWSEAGVRDRIDLILAPALESLKNFSGKSFDLIFIDADKKNYPIYYQECLNLLSETGVMLLDNVLWNGRVIDPNYTDKLTKVIRNLNETIKNDSRVDICMLPIGDGLTMIRKIGSGGGTRTPDTRIMIPMF